MLLYTSNLNSLSAPWQSSSYQWSVSLQHHAVTTDNETDVYLVDATSGCITITLAPTACALARRIDIKKIDSSVNTVTIDGNLAETIDGSLTKVLSTQYDSYTIITDGSNWFIL